LSKTVDNFTITPLSPIRKAIAARVAEATRTIPHFRLVADIRADALLRFRDELRASHPDKPLSLNDLIIKGCAAALMDVPDVNVHWAESELHQFQTADIAVVVSVNGALYTPVIRDSNLKSLWDISQEVRAMAARAAQNALKLNEVSGGSFTVSNLGMHGVDQFDAIINPPQCAILAVGAAKLTPVVCADHKCASATVMRTTLSADHRAIDGAMAARFLERLRQHLEQPTLRWADGGDSRCD
jgi:pyruvate dehydrogenase E2 component (dihydrolipoamide acetyltransferase)